MTQVHQDSPWRATYRTAVSRCGSASAARMRGNWKSATSGSITSSITHPRINQVAHSSIAVVQFDGDRTVRRTSNAEGADVREETVREDTGVRQAELTRRPVAAPGDVPGGQAQADPRRWLMLPVVL